MNSPTIILDVTSDVIHTSEADTGEVGLRETISNSSSKTNACIWYQFITNVIIMGVICIFGLAGNTLSCIILMPRAKKNATALLLVVLAVSDNVTLIAWSIMTVFPTLFQVAGGGDYYDSYIFAYKSKIIWPFGTVSHMVGSWIVTLVTVHRYIAVCFPLRAKQLGNIRWARIQIALVIGASIVFYIPLIVSTAIIKKADRYVYVNVPTNIAYTIGYKVIAYYILIYVIPFSSLIFMTSRLLVALRRAKFKRDQMTGTKRDEEDITKTLVVVVIVFMICQLPNPIRRILYEMYDASERGCPSFYAYYYSVSRLAVAFNSSINFVIYCLFGQRFRRSLRARIFCRGKVSPMVTTTYHNEGSRTDTM